jgi:hypothetical protein
VKQEGSEGEAKGHVMKESYYIRDQATPIDQHLSTCEKLLVTFGEQQKHFFEMLFPPRNGGKSVDTILRQSDDQFLQMSI